MYGAVAVVDSLTEKIASELEGDPTVIATGGFAHIISPKCKSVDIIDTHLTLEGLYMIWEKIKK